MRFGAVVLCLNEFTFLSAVVGQLLKVCDRVLVVRNHKSFSGAPVSLRPMLALDPRAELLVGEWADEAATRNAGTAHLSDCDYVFTLDSDEIVTIGGLEFLKAQVIKGHRAMGCHLWTYWKTPMWRIDPPERICATAVIRKDVKFEYLRRIDSSQAIVNTRLIHHLSYVRTDGELREKISSFGHAKEVVDGWFERVWTAWDGNHEMRNLHPTHPSAYVQAVPVVSRDLLDVLAEHGVVGWW